MGIAIPRPAMRKREIRIISWRLTRLMALTHQFQGQGMERERASAKAYRIVKAERPPRHVLRGTGAK